MNIVTIMGSHRNGKHTQKALDYFLNQLTGTNVVENINVNKVEIKHCLACDYCLKHQGECVIKDDAMKGIYEKIEESDLFVIATPVYFSAFPSRIKTLIDRTQVLYNLEDRSIIKNKDLVVIGVGGAPKYGRQFQAIENTLEFYTKYLNCNQLGFVKFSHSDDVAALENEEKLAELKALAEMVNQKHSS